MTIIPHTTFAKHGISGLLSTLTPTGAGQSPSLMKLQLIRMELLSARLVTGWYTGVTVQAAAGVNGAAHWPAGKWIPAHARINAPNPHTGGVSIRNLTGIYGFTRQLPEVHRNIKKFIKTAHPVNG